MLNIMIFNVCVNQVLIYPKINRDKVYANYVPLDRILINIIPLVVKDAISIVSHRNMDNKNVKYANIELTHQEQNVMINIYVTRIVRKC